MFAHHVLTDVTDTPRLRCERLAHVPLLPGRKVKCSFNERFFLPPRCRALRGVSSLRFLPSLLLGTKSAADQSFLKRWAADDHVPPNSDRHRFLCRRWHVVGRNNFTWTWKDFKEINVVSLLVFSFSVRVCKKAGLPLVSSPASLFTALY